ncbi:hypothetical protein AX16_001463 [Volvariella volvacea WC 439]|nr:hypothetical protein AX16_001463 [Volvariella volvacea WC 439]
MSPSANASGVTTTPTRERLPFTPSSHPSPAALSQRSVTTSALASSSGPSTASSSTSVPSSSSVTVEGLLKHHASAQNPQLAALEQAVNERNVLSSQNAQLWKLIEKQRAGYNQVLKELERVRGERDGYKSRLSTLVNGQTPHIERRREDAKISAESLAGRSSESSSDHMLHARDIPVRHNSDDQATPRPHYAHPILHTSRSHEPLSPPERDTSLQNSTLNQLQTPTNASTSSSLSRPQKSQSTSQSTPLVVPPRSESLSIPPANHEAPHTRQSNPSATMNEHAVSSTNGDATYSQSTIRPSTYSRLNDDGDVSTGSSTFSLIPSNGIAQVPSSYHSTTRDQPDDDLSDASSDDQGRSSEPPYPQLPTITTSPMTPPSSAQQQTHFSVQSTQDSHMLTTHLESHSHALSRDSRITLPDEARHYIANMPDSPLPSPSPNVDTFMPRPPQSGPHPLSQSTTAESGLTPPAGSSQSDSPVSNGEFLDMDSDHLEEEDDDVVDVGKEAWTSQSHQAHSNPQDISTPHSQPHTHKAKSRAAPEDFPLPPSNAPLPVQSAAATSHSEPYETSESSHFTSTTTLIENDAVHPHPPQHSMTTLPASKSESTHREAVPASFRALPLLSSDLPYTTISVSHSFVRPNDRGKEVLSFIIHVNPGNNKEPWKVEKMYSDVLALDHRVRSSVGKSVAKRIMTLPEGKLWKDHAPAKVDQRKTVLEQYLQSLIKLPVKNNDEVVAFFTSDIVRETKQPVMQAGHKEGYLTKRGKNFGGWKTRYFVLQGPVLEYYDCRGGTHLGSILVTGAQIGRQQRTEKSGHTDEEKEYRHAFLIVEAKRGPGGNHPRHVLCAESDEERDSWVEMLVRYFTGAYTEEPLSYGPVGADSPSYQPRTSTSTNEPMRRPGRSVNKEDITVSKPQLVTTDVKAAQATLADDQSASSIRTVDSSPIDRGVGGFYDSHNARRVVERTQGQPSSLPDSSPLSSTATFPTDAATGLLGQRANSELGHYPDHHDPRAVSAGQGHRQQSPERHRNHNERKVFPPNVASLPTAHSDRPPSPDKDSPVTTTTGNKIKISGPMNGAPIPQGFKFGGKDPTPDTANSSSANDRREKAKSRSFWGFGKANLMGERSAQPATPYVPRAVFGVTLEEALDVAQIANLPAIVFRTIQYLEAKKADQEEGIYRLSGSSAVIKALRDRFNAEGDVDLLASDEYWDPHAIAGLLKSFLRELPASILTRDLHLKFLSVIRFCRCAGADPRVIPAHCGFTTCQL